MANPCYFLPRWTAYRSRPDVKKSSWMKIPTELYGAEYSHLRPLERWVLTCAIGQACRMDGNFDRATVLAMSGTNGNVFDSMAKNLLKRKLISRVA